MVMRSAAGAQSGRSREAARVGGRKRHIEARAMLGAARSKKGRMCIFHELAAELALLFFPFLHTHIIQKVGALSGPVN
jgi:hypothetical protein